MGLRGYPARPPIERALEKMAPPDRHGCRLWAASYREETGQCHLTIGSGHVHTDARRVIWEHQRREQLDGRILPHCPRNRRCVEPSHQGEPLCRAEWKRQENERLAAVERSAAA